MSISTRRLAESKPGVGPVLVVSNDMLNSRPLVVSVIPGTRGSRVPTDYPGNVRVAAGEAGLAEETVFMAFQIRALDPGRFPKQPVGQLTSDRMKDIDQALSWSMGLGTS